MITIILEKKLDKVVKKLSKPGNENYLSQEEPKFQKLSEIDNCSYSTFSSEDMNQLEEELSIIKTKVTEAERIHIDDILELAQKCKKNKNLYLTFTPFDE